MGELSCILSTHTSPYWLDDYKITFNDGMTTFEGTMDTIDASTLHDWFSCDTGSSFGIKKVIFNEPATIVYWEDGTKTVVKCQNGDTFSKEIGLITAIAKKAYGNKGSYNNVLKKWCE